ncbi:hypothetical protein [Brevundimonas subvibrioides]|uniref:Type II secretion system protein N n=1 Tax=Brevundimonas subvibrioides (strain ATCC 15264 / DSM 4735 / LMG 14903 / NBRC 16000 / CB 81) TaxID=633149 RepID=D9QKU6_BRESC|nr:hypothetical protein [Brevundimonas subvibrioides]ADL01760.1 hypothetical protein Bresu_2451 [Brevundimonas subvibrioides ATCC 15264]
MMKVWRTRDGDDGRAGGAFQFERLTVRVTRWRVVLAGVAVGAYALGLIAMAPSEIVVARSSNGERQAVGTVWAGERALPGGFGAGWTLMPFASILHLSAAERITLRGPETEASTQVLVRPGRVLIRDLEGTMSMRMLNAVAPGLPFACSPVMRLEVESLALKGAPAGAGRILSGPGECAATGGAATPIAALTGTVSAEEGASNVVFTRAGGTEPVLRARVQADGTLTASVEPGGVGLLPGIGAPMSIDTTL